MSEHDNLDIDDLDMGDVEALLRELTDEDQALHEPPLDLWADIEAEALGGAVADTSAEAAAPIAPVVSLAERRSRRPVILGAAVAAALIVMVGVAAMVLQSDSTPERLAAADLAYDAEAFDALGADAAASVSLVDDGGELRLAIDESSLPAPDEAADLELWMISLDDDGNPDEIISLGLVESASATYALPAGVDPDRHIVVDISVEPRDGVETHSGASIVRGPIVEA